LDQIFSCKKKNFGQYSDSQKFEGGKKLPPVKTSLTDDDSGVVYRAEFIEWFSERTA